MKRLLFVGEAPSRDSDPTVPLGHRGRDWMSKVSGMPRERIERGAGFVNLLGSWPGPALSKGSLFPPEQARQAALSFDPGEHEALALCGHRVAKAFGLKGYSYLSPAGAVKGRPTWVMPHPSGINMWWNDQQNRQAFADWLWGLIG